MQDMMDPKGLSPVTLAFLGDSVFELYIRERIVRDGSVPAAKLHNRAVRRVRGTAQALAYDAVWDACTEEERSILRRGRNVSLSRCPASCTPEQYHKATAIEALLGYVHLKGETARLQELCELIDKIISGEEERRDGP